MVQLGGTAPVGAVRRVRASDRSFAGERGLCLRLRARLLGEERRVRSLSGSAAVARNADRRSRAVRGGRPAQRPLDPSPPAAGVRRGAARTVSAWPRRAGRSGILAVVFPLSPGSGPSCPPSVDRASRCRRRQWRFAMANILFGIVAGAVGMGYLLYGKRQTKFVPIIAGILLCVYPYFFDSVLWLGVVGG